ncbi:MAG: hypothetical protein HYY21_11850 [Candidatus Tectomicrobia bacterium]|nr:hypothetical protein [Candidatus Tectomicrobia bacterium]
MKKMLAVTAAVAFAFTAAAAAPVLAQKKHTPKAVWKGMLQNLDDVKAMVSALTVFDMERLASIADQFAAREERFSKNPRFPDAVKKYYGDLASVIKEVGAAARAGEEARVSEKIGGVLQVCSGCHYNVRDAAARK